MAWVIRRNQGLMGFPQKAMRVFLGVLIILATIPFSIEAQTQNASDSGTQSDYPPLTPEELDSLVAPIALYPDALVAQVLGAATYPDEVTAADSWLKQNSGLQGQGLMSAADKQ
ncbi:MAG TPA: DUF3300 domain-containing protein, partial [Candidatus Acidoferrales bacterium]